jgi:hypothetical protein
MLSGSFKRRESANLMTESRTLAIVATSSAALANGLIHFSRCASYDW